MEESEMKYRKRPVEIEAVLIEDNDNAYHWAASFPIGTTTVHKVPEAAQLGGGVIINTLEGKMYGPVGHYLIRGVQGEFYACEPNIFRETYEEVE